MLLPGLYSVVYAVVEKLPADELKFVVGFILCFFGGVLLGVMLVESAVVCAVVERLQLKHFLTHGTTLRGRISGSGKSVAHLVLPPGSLPLSLQSKPSAPWAAKVCTMTLPTSKLN